MHQEGERPDTGEGSEDSDYESNSEQANESTPEVQDDTKEEVEPESLPLLITGSFARYSNCRWQAQVSNFSGSWRSLFFYLCTDTIQFAPLTSQGVFARTKFVQDKKIPGMPPPCSPKTIYTLATAVCSHFCVLHIF